MSETRTQHTPPWTSNDTAPLPREAHTAPQWFDSPGSAQPPPPTPPARKDSPLPSNRRRIGELSAVAVLAAALASGGTYAATQLGSTDAQTPSAASSSSSLGRGTGTSPVVQADPNNPNWTATAAAVAPSVVSITNRLGNGVAQGSGVVIDDKGHVLTNNHVVADTQKLTVTLSNGHTYDATIAGTDPSTDLAVVTIKNFPSTLTPIALGDSGSLKVGDPVMAVGNPLGLAGTVTTGIVSALNRPVKTQSSEQQTPVDPFGNPFGQQGQQQSGEPVVTNAIQTSAAINPGNSGGALVDGSGKLVGINSAIASLGSSSSSQSGNIGIGFAIPVNEAKNIAAQLIDKGAAAHPYLGVTLTDGSGSDGSSTVTGAKIENVVSGTPAAAAGLRSGDLVVAIDGTTVESADSLIGSVRAHSVGDTVDLTVLRGGSKVVVKATLVARSTTS
jgi:putative serine protease PepD